MKQRKINNKYKAIVFGSTGACGKYVLQSLLKSSLCEKILLINRRDDNPSLKNQSKVEQLIWEDFSKKLVWKSDNLPEVYVEYFKGYDTCFSCLGQRTDQSKNTKDYIIANESYPTNIGVLCEKANVNYHYYISSTGANRKSWLLYPRIKGNVEKNLENLNFKGGVAIFRPSLLIAKRENIDKKEEFAKFFLPCMKCFGLKNYYVDVSDVGKAMVNHFEKNWKMKNSIKQFKEIILTKEIKKLSEL